MIGFGYDTHRLASGEILILGGIIIDSDIGTTANSDGDVLLHSIMDSLLGAAGLGDIGEHFPDTGPDYKNADSAELTKIVVKMLLDRSLTIINVDATIVLERPKLSGYKEMIRKNTASILDIPVGRVNIKATTNEKMGPEGRSESITVYSVCEIQDKSA